MSVSSSKSGSGLPAPVLQAPKALNEEETIRLLEEEHERLTSGQSGINERSPLVAGKDEESQRSVPDSPGGSVAEGPKSLTQNAGIIVALVALIASRTVDQVLYYRLARMYASYTWALGAIILSAGYLMVLWPVVWYKMYYSGEITMEHRQFPQKALFIMAMFDTAGNVLGTWPLPYIPSSIVNVLSNSVLPMTMVASVVLLKTGYRWTHYLGAVLVVSGIMVRMIPTFGAGEKETLTLPGIWIPIYLLSLLPAAPSNVYKEGGLKGITSDVWHVNAWIAVWQLGLGFLTMPTVFIPWPNSPDVIHPNELGEYLSNASTCFFLGKNPRPGSPDDCGGVFWVFVVYLAFNVAFNQLMLVVFKKGSSVLAVISSTVRLPIVDVLLLWGFLAGAAKISKITVYDAFALLIIIAGIVSYKWRSEIKKEINPEEPHVPGLASPSVSPAIGDSGQKEARKKKRWTPSFLANRGMAAGNSPAFPKRF